MAGRHILVIGSGSVGQRHAANLAALGCRISCLDPRQDRRAELAAATPVVGAYGDLPTALGDPSLDGAVIASPTTFHVRQARAALAAGLAVLLEKPVSPGAEEARALALAVAESEVPLLLGYTWRWWPPLLAAKRLLAEGALGRLNHVRFVMAAHLADWHPWERYQDWFMSSRELGGGALLDESHWIDQALWFFGRPESVFARIAKVSELEIDADDDVDILLDYAAGPRVSIHLDLHARPHEKTIKFVGQEGTLVWTADPNRLVLGREMAENWQETLFDCQRNEMFVAVAREFLALLDGRGAPSCTIADGLNVMEVIEASRQSHAEGRMVKLESGR
ncbi:MAG TPA: Gfo/Idh/MocA family oxidoreductase [Alphaproteobacteria bacterium]|nr:Gfo/Idh/MocA family oxidoreductase [Alphaproteobacteria bacterium]